MCSRQPNGTLELPAEPSVQPVHLHIHVSPIAAELPVSISVPAPSKEPPGPPIPSLHQRDGSGAELDRALSNGDSADTDAQVLARQLDEERQGAAALLGVLYGAAVCSYLEMAAAG